METTDDFNPTSYTWVLKLQEEVDNLNEIIKLCEENENTKLADNCEYQKRLLIENAAKENSSLGHTKKCISMIECFLDNSIWETL